MFYHLKQSLIQSAMLRRKARSPFDERACELFTIRPDDPHEINNSFFLGAHTSTGDDITMRFGFRNGGDAELFIIYRAAGRVLYMEHDHYPSDAFPATVECLEVAKRWRYTFDGNLRDALGTTYTVSFDLTFSAVLPIFDFTDTPTSHPGMTSAIAAARWDRTFFRSLSSSSQRHYEQTGRVTGAITVDGVSRTIDWAAVRDRAVGKRVWDFMNCHIWLNATTDQGQAITVSLVTYPILTSLFSGYTNIGRDANVWLTDCRLMDYDHADGMGPDCIRVYTGWSDGRYMVVTAKRDSNVLCTFDNGDYYFQEGLGDFMVNGVPARGNIEYGFNKDRTRWQY